jgi:hypothetical protein
LFMAVYKGGHFPSYCLLRHMKPLFLLFFDYSCMFCHTIMLYDVMTCP